MKKILSVIVLAQFLTVISLQITNHLALVLPPQYLYLILAIGPLFGLVSVFMGNDRKSNFNSLAS